MTLECHGVYFSSRAPIVYKDNDITQGLNLQDFLLVLLLRDENKNNDITHKNSHIHIFNDITLTKLLIIDLRIYWSDKDPINELYKLWKAYEPQIQDYKSRALDPTKAPSYGVPGDL